MSNKDFRTLAMVLIIVAGISTFEVKGQNAGVLRGTVKLKDTPVGGVMVEVRSANSGRKSSLSNSKGEYEIVNLLNGTYLLTVGNTPYVLNDAIGGAFIQLEIKGSGVTVADLDLTKGAVITGCAEYPSKQPVIERQVVYENANLQLNGFSLMSFRPAFITNDRGCFRLYGLPDGKYRVGVGKPLSGTSTDLPAPFSTIYYPGVQRQSDAQLVEVTAGHEINLGTLILKDQAKTSVVRGTFVNTDTGDPVPNFNFELVSFDERGISSISNLKSDQAGEFRIDNQVLGRYRIQPVVNNSEGASITFKSISFEVTETGLSDLIIQCSSLTASIKGDVIINNSYSASDKDCSIALKEGDGLDASNASIYRATLKRGKFELFGIPRGVYTLVVLPRRTSLRYEGAQVGTQNLRGTADPFGFVRIDLTGGDQAVKVFLNESANTTP